MPRARKKQQTEAPPTVVQEFRDAVSEAEDDNWLQKMEPDEIMTATTLHDAGVPFREAFWTTMAEKYGLDRATYSYVVVSFFGGMVRHRKPAPVGVILTPEELAEFTKADDADTLRALWDKVGAKYGWQDRDTYRYLIDRETGEVTRYRVPEGERTAESIAAKMKMLQQLLSMSWAQLHGLSEEEPQEDLPQLDCRHPRFGPHGIN
jgi:hypothetical protein